MRHSAIGLWLAAAALAGPGASSCGGLVGFVAEEPPGSGSTDAGADTGATPIDPAADASTLPGDAASDASPPIAADGVCVDANVSTGIVDPDCVYLLGTLQEGDAWKNVLIDPRDPKDRAFGFGYTLRAPIIHPKTGKLTFIAHADSNPMRRLYTFGSSTPPTAYANAQLAAHTIVPTRCTGDSLFEHYLFPDDGVLAYDCLGNPGPTYIDGVTAPFDRQGHSIVAVGAGRVVLAAKTAPEYALLVGGAVVPVQGLDTNTTLYAVRSLPSGGFIAAANATGVRGQLIEIAVDGTTTVKGPYDFGMPPLGPGPRCVLEPSGALVCLQLLQASPIAVDGIYRFRLGAPPELLYDERSSDVKIHISYLVTGP